MSFIPTETGEWVSEEFERLARVVEDYDPKFYLAWVPPDKRVDPGDMEKCYAVIEQGNEGQDFVVFYAGVLDTPESILTRLFNSDGKHGNVLDRIEAHNAAVQALQMKEELDHREELMDRAAWLAKTPKNFINMGNGRVVDDQLRPVRNGKRKS